MWSHVGKGEVCMALTREIESFVSRWSQLSEPHGIMVVQGGQVAYERYWAPFRADIPHAMYSFSKTVTAMAVGLAIRERALGLDTRLVEMFPDHLPAVISPHLAACTVEHLLTMTCGHSDEIEPFMPASPEAGDEAWIRAFLAWPFDHEPGTHFFYNTMGTTMLAAILRRATGVNLVDYLMPRLFEPLGIARPWCVQERDGTDAGGLGFSLTVRDMARFMWCVMHGGEWRGAQLMDPAFVERAIRVHASNADWGGDPDWQKGYGYQVWRCQPPGVYRADGMWGQYGIAFPEHDALVVLTQHGEQQQGVLQAVWDMVLPALAARVKTDTASHHDAPPTVSDALSADHPQPEPEGSLAPCGRYSGDLGLEGTYSTPPGTDFNRAFRLTTFDTEPSARLDALGFDGRSVAFHIAGETVSVLLEQDRLTAFQAAGQWYAAAGGTGAHGPTLELRRLQVGLTGGHAVLAQQGDGTLRLTATTDFCPIPCPRTPLTTTLRPVPAGNE